MRGCNHRPIQSRQERRSLGSRRAIDGPNGYLERDVHAAGVPDIEDERRRSDRPVYAPRTQGSRTTSRNDRDPGSDEEPTGSRFYPPSEHSARATAGQQWHSSDESRRALARGKSGKRANQTIGGSWRTGG